MNYRGFEIWTFYYSNDEVAANAKGDGDVHFSIRGPLDSGDAITLVKMTVDMYLDEDIVEEK